MTTFQRSTLIGLTLALLCAFVATGCNTTRGLGKDVERAGEKIQENASR